MYSHFDSQYLKRIRAGSFLFLTVVFGYYLRWNDCTKTVMPDISALYSEFIFLLPFLDVQIDEAFVYHYGNTFCCTAIATATAPWLHFPIAFSTIFLLPINNGTR